MEVTPTRTVDGNLLVSTALPAIAVRVDLSLAYSDRLPFVLYVVARVDLFLFVQAEGARASGVGTVMVSSSGGLLQGWWLGDEQGRDTRVRRGSQPLGEDRQDGVQPGAPVMSAIMEHQPTATEEAQPVRGRPLPLACPRFPLSGAASRRANADLH